MTALLWALELATVNIWLYVLMADLNPQMLKILVQQYS